MPFGVVERIKDAQALTYGEWGAEIIDEMKPQEGDILVYGRSPNNPFGHTGIICEVGKNHIVLIQQNYGSKTRQKLNLVEFEGIYTVADYDVLGWLRHIDQ